MNEATLDFINHVDKDIQPLVEQVHDVLKDIEPRYHVEQGFDGLVFYLDENVSCVMQVFNDHVKLTVRKGRALSDPSSILDGDRQEPYVFIDGHEGVPAGELEELLVQQFELLDSDEDDFEDDDEFVL